MKMNDRCVGFRFGYIFDYSLKVRHIEITVSASERNERRKSFKIITKTKEPLEKKKGTVRNLLPSGLTYLYGLVAHGIYRIRFTGDLKKKNITRALFVTPCRRSQLKLEVKLDAIV